MMHAWLSVMAMISGTSTPRVVDDWITIQRWSDSAWETHAEDGDILISTYIDSIDYTRNPPNVTLKGSATGLWRI